MTFASAIEIPTVGQSTDDVKDTEKFETVKFSWAKHHQLWLNCLQDVADGKIKRLMGMMCPGSAKSTYSSVVFPTWYLGRFPNKQIILASYGSELPKKLGRRARSIIKQPIYQRIFDTQLSEESAAADEWALTNGSEWMAGGILTGITGNRADGIIWDDLLKGRADAESEPIRNKTWDEYMESLLSRKKPNGWEVGINTRWHEDDVCGRILPEGYNGESGWIKCRDGCDWFVVCLPAEAEREDDILGRKLGERIWPEWFGPDFFKPFKMNKRTWSALYQQRPAPESGAFFEADWFKPYTDPPKREILTIYGASDFAVTADKERDWTVHVVVGIDPHHRIYLLDLWRAQVKPDKSIEKFCDLVEKWRPMGWAEETGQIKNSLGPFLEKRMRERRLYCPRVTFPTKGEGKKEIRAQSIAGRMSMSGLWVPVQEPWYPAFVKEMLTFPYGAHDDQCLVAGTLISMANGQQKPIENVSVGELVVTPIGPKPVLAAKQTSNSASVFRVMLSNGSKITGTGNHPIFVKKNGFVRLDALQVMDEVLSIDEGRKCEFIRQRQKFLFTGGTGIVGTPMGHVPTVVTSLLHHRVLDFCTGTFGKMLTGLFLPNTIFTTLMATQLTTPFPILSAYQKKTIEENIGWLARQPQKIDSSSPKLSNWPVNGINQKLGGNFIRNWENKVGLIGKVFSEFAYVVKQNLKHFLIGQNTAQTNVVSVIGIEALTVPMAVHNLTVADANVYYANGILTHNCDAMALIGQVLDKMVAGSSLAIEEPKTKVLSTDPKTCTVTLDDMFEANERFVRKDDPKILRIH